MGSFGSKFSRQTKKLDRGGVGFPGASTGQRDVFQSEKINHGFAHASDGQQIQTSQLPGKCTCHCLLKHYACFGKTQWEGCLTYEKRKGYQAVMSKLSWLSAFPGREHWCDEKTAEGIHAALPPSQMLGKMSANRTVYFPLNLTIAFWEKNKWTNKLPLQNCRGLGNTTARKWLEYFSCPQMFPFQLGNQHTGKYLCSSAPGGLLCYTTASLTTQCVVNILTWYRPLANKVETFRGHKKGACIVWLINYSVERHHGSPRD